MKLLLLAILHLVAFSISYAQTPLWKSAIKAGGNRYESINNQVLDSKGNRIVSISSQSDVFTVGSTNIPTNPPDPANANRRSTSVIVKIDKNNQILWSIKNSNSLSLGTYTTDVNDNIYLFIAIREDQTFLGQSLIHSKPFFTIFLAKLTPNGLVIWIKQKSILAQNVTEIEDNHFFVFRTKNPGYPHDTVDGYIFTDTTDYIIKFDTNGSLVKKISIGKFYRGEGNPIILSKNRLFIVGTYGHGLDSKIDTTIWTLPPPLPIQQHAFVAAFNHNLDFQWSRRVDTKQQFNTFYPEISNVFSREVDKDGNIVIAGQYQSQDSIWFDSLALQNQPVSPPADISINCFIAAYDSTGKVKYARVFGSDREDNIIDIDIDSIGNLFLTGGSQATFQVDGFGDPLNSGSNWQLKLDSKTLKAKWMKQLFGMRRGIQNMDIDGKGNLWLNGLWWNYFLPNQTPPLQLDSIILPLSASASGYPNQTDAFLARLGNCNLINPTLSVILPQTICQGDSLTLTCSPFQKYQWNTDDSTQSITIKKPGRYHCYIYDSLGCYAKSNVVEIKVNQSTSSNINKSICLGSSYLGYSQSGLYKDTLTGSNGCDSVRTLNLSVLPAIIFSQSISLCNGQSLLVGTRTYNTTGIYKDTLIASNGCDSIVTSTLNYTIPNDSIQFNGQSLIASTGQDNYQWLDCNQGFAPISGETNSTFVPTTNGSYAVKVTLENCSDTSNCILFTSDMDLLSKAGKLLIQPNPSSGKATLKWEGGKTGAKILIQTIEGKTLSTIHLDSNKSVILPNLPSGVYFIKPFQSSLTAERWMVE